MESKSNNTALVIIAFAVVLIVAMLCAVAVWAMQRSMALNEKLLDVRIAEAAARQGSPLAATSAPASAEAPKAASTPRQPVSSSPAPKKTTLRKASAPQKASSETGAAESPKASAGAAPNPTLDAPPPKIKAPVERPDAKVGPDGQPLDRILLSVGEDDIDWQF